jgi:hypothetical protein
MHKIISTYTKNAIARKYINTRLMTYLSIHQLGKKYFIPVKIICT